MIKVLAGVRGQPLPHHMLCPSANNPVNRLPNQPTMTHLAASPHHNQPHNQPQPHNQAQPHAPSDNQFQQLAEPPTYQPPIEVGHLSTLQMEPARPPSYSVVVSKEEQKQQAAPSAPEPSAPPHDGFSTTKPSQHVCTSCTRAFTTSDVFCPQCGARR